MGLTALIDANVFYGARLRSLMLFLAQTGLFRARWTAMIHDEWTRNLLAKRPDLDRHAIMRVRDLMDASVLDCLVTGYESLIPSLTLPDANDRHVLAAAIRGLATVVVTFNLKDFPDETLRQYGLCAKHPDEFLLDLFGLDEKACLDAVQADFSHYKTPPLSIDDYLAALAKAGVTQTAAFLRERKIVFE